jgi:hypothetical protein
MTAVEWLREQLFGDKEIIGCSDELLNQAKEMERQQIIDAFNDGFLNIDKEAEQYYNEQFKNK